MKNVFQLKNKYIVNDCKTENNDKDEEVQIEEDDYIVKCIGNCGVWQIIVCCVVSSIRFIGMWNALSILFLTPAQSFKCVKFKDNSTIIPETSKCYANCEEYEHSRNIFDETIVSQFGLICERAWMANFTQTVLMFGILLGISLFGWISDRFGRMKAVVISGLINVVFMVAIIFSPNYWLFIWLRFCVGISTGGLLGLSPVIVSETLGAKYREMGVALGLIPDSLAEATLAGFAYIATTWKTYSAGFTICSALIVFMVLFLPESPRWLVANGKSEQAVQVLTSAARFNKTTISTSEIKAIVDQHVAIIKTVEKDDKHYTYLDLFKTKKLFIITVSSVVAWTVSGATYYGINQYISFLASDLNIYYVVSILGLSTIPTVPFTIFVAKMFKRKLSTCISFLIVTLSMFSLIFIATNSWYSVILGAIAIFSSCIAVDVQFIHVTELYPTSIRNMGFGLSAAGIKFGAILAPFLTNTKPDWLSPLVFAILPIVAVIFTLLLPETKGKKLEDTLEE